MIKHENRKKIEYKYVIAESDAPKRVLLWEGGFNRILDLTLGKQLSYTFSNFFFFLKDKRN